LCLFQTVVDYAYTQVQGQIINALHNPRPNSTIFTIEL